MSTVLRSAGLGKKYRKRWALSDCTLTAVSTVSPGIVRKIPCRSTARPKS